MRLCAVVPSYRHVSQLPRLSRRLVELCDLVLIVDDGNAEPARSALAALHDPAGRVEVLRLDANAGKGVAVLTGFREAIARGFTHALQIDADGQHDVEDVPRFIAAALARPDALICGQAVYDESVPKARKIGRWITHVWVWIETASLDIADSMCGFRLYPLTPVARVIARTRIGSRMDFDTEMAVHMHWRGVPAVNLPTKVIYPPDNVSNFEMLADNVRISKMHTRLALQAPFRLIGKLWMSVVR
ncbi:glycosyltransferase family 2 protein [Brevundimonas sp. FT23028]|uniref:glycosyltransferase family 2 protein n=1 Tax=Brevundimonas sp. FT23028 TaxID=3393748 RepID=UPI003B587CDC